MRIFGHLSSRLYGSREVVKVLDLPMDNKAILNYLPRDTVLQASSDPL